jgi:hypothetical protein
VFRLLSLSLRKRHKRNLIDKVHDLAPIRELPEFGRLVPAGDAKPAGTTPHQFGH